MKKLLTLTFAGICLLSQHGFALIAIDLPGNTNYSGWTGLTSANNPGYPGFGSGELWPSPILPNVSGSATTVGLDKISGPGNPGGGSLYSFAAPTTFTLASTSPLASLQTLVLQLDMGNGADGIFFGAAPVLGLNGGTQSFAADYTATATGDFPFSNPTTGDPGFSTILAFQWDLSTFVDPITSYDITWTVHDHSQTYAIQLNTGDTAVQAIPEPTSAILLGIAGLMLASKRKRRRAKPLPH